MTQTPNPIIEEPISMKIVPDAKAIAQEKEKKYLRNKRTFFLFLHNFMNK